MIFSNIFAKTATFLVSQGGSSAMGGRADSSTVQQAEQFFQEALQHCPQNVNAMLGLASLLRHKGDVEQCQVGTGLQFGNKIAAFAEITCFKNVGSMQKNNICRSVPRRSHGDAVRDDVPQLGSRGSSCAVGEFVEVPS